MSKKYVLALDQGTTSSRAIVFDKKGEIIAKAQNEFDQIYPKAAGVCAYAMTTALKKTGLCLKPFSGMKVLVNGEEVVCSEFQVEKGDVILVKSLKGEKWGFAFEKTAPIGIPFLESARVQNR